MQGRLLLLKGTSGVLRGGVPCRLGWIQLSSLGRKFTVRGKEDARLWEQHLQGELGSRHLPSRAWGRPVGPMVVIKDYTS